MVSSDVDADSSETVVGPTLHIERSEEPPPAFEPPPIAPGDLMYVKEDLILPHGTTFYELIVNKARGKSGPLFHFDVHDDVRVGAIDHRVDQLFRPTFFVPPPFIIHRHERRRRPLPMLCLWAPLTISVPIYIYICLTNSSFLGMVLLPLPKVAIISRSNTAKSL